jgi:hypothetical protein
MAEKCVTKGTESHLVWDPAAGHAATLHSGKLLRWGKRKDGECRSAGIGCHGRNRQKPVFLSTARNLLIVVDVLARESVGMFRDQGRL